MGAKHYFYAIEWGIDMLTGQKRAERVHRFDNKALRNVWIAKNPDMRSASPSTSIYVRRAIKYGYYLPWPIRI